LQQLEGTSKRNNSNTCKALSKTEMKAHIVKNQASRQGTNVVDGIGEGNGLDTFASIIYEAIKLLLVM
jgi:hypothetical protein